MRKSCDKKKVFEYLDKDLSATASAKLLNTTSSTVKSRLNNWGYVFKIINGWNGLTKIEKSKLHKNPDKLLANNHKIQKLPALQVTT